MNYDFTKRERGFGRMVFALTLDRKKMTERIVIGEAEEVRRGLERDANVQQPFCHPAQERQHSSTHRQNHHQRSR